MTNSKQFKVGIFGCGHISDTHIKSWKKTKHSEVHGVFDLSADLVNKKEESKAKAETALNDFLQKYTWENRVSRILELVNT